jgi:hypothetical protein
MRPWVDAVRDRHAQTSAHPLWSRHDRASCRAQPGPAARGRGDGTDSGAVFLRSTWGTSIWDYDRGETYRFAGRNTPVADVRNGVILYTGPPPTDNTQGWRLVPGAIDAQLTFDGEHVLYWSDTLEPAFAGGAPITLDLPQPAAFFAMDTDGSVLAATACNPSEVFDCELPSESCVPIGEMGIPHGDPMFIGVDM